MTDPGAFCQAVMHEYERQWSRAGGHALRHPLRLKIEALRSWCDAGNTPERFDEELQRAQESDDAGLALLACELRPLWEKVRSGGRLPPPYSGD